MVDALKIENNEIKTIFLNKIKENILSDCDFFGNISVIVENDDETQLRQEMHCVLTIINDIYGNVEFRNKNKELNKIFFNKNEIFISGDSVNFICGTAEVFQMSGLSKKHYNIIRYIKDRVGDDS